MDSAVVLHSGEVRLDATHSAAAPLPQAASEIATPELPQTSTAHDLDRLLPGEKTFRVMIYLEEMSSVGMAEKRANTGETTGPGAATVVRRARLLGLEIVVRSRRREVESRRPSAAEVDGLLLR